MIRTRYRYRDGGASGEAADYRVVAKGGHIMESMYANSSLYTRAEKRSSVVMGKHPCDNIRFVIWNGYVQQGEKNGSNSITVEMGLERLSPAQTVLFTWDGAATKTLAAGEYAITDPIPASAFSLSEYPADETFYARTGLTVTSGGTWPQNPSSGYLSPGASHNGVVGFTGTSSSQISATGALSIPSGGAGFFTAVLMGPAAIVGTWVGSKVPSVMLMGDSIMSQLDDAVDNGAGGGGGFGVRATYNVNSSQLPIIRAGRGGEQASHWASGNTFRTYLMQFCTHLINNLVVNDISAGRSSAQIITDLQTINTAFTNNAVGAKYLCNTTCSPRTNSTDSWATVANQTAAAAAFDVGGVRDIFNTSLLALQGSGIDLVFNVNTYWQDPTDTECWLTTGVANANTDDGTHPNDPLHLTAATGLNTLLAAWTTT